MQAPKCPHGCRPTKAMQWADDQWYCPHCGDEWSDEQMQSGGCCGLAPHGAEHPCGQPISSTAKHGDTRLYGRFVFISDQLLDELYEHAIRSASRPVMAVVNLRDSASPDPLGAVYRDLASDDRFDENFDPHLASRIALEALGYEGEPQDDS